jgi:dTDP-4-amino-4,6-dideoxygalactose transaminase
MSQKFLPLAKPVLGKEEERAVIAALRSGWITLGPKTAEFEEAFKKYIGCKHAIAVNSATAALDLAMYDLHLQKGEQVIIPAFTFAATANTIIHAGGTPVIADVDPKTFCLDPKSVEKKINKKTRAIVAVHYAGHPADMKSLHALAKKYELKLVEDAATAVGTEYRGKKIGDDKHPVCFSFHPIKNMTTGDGGMLTTNDEAQANRLRLLRLQGMSKEAWKRLDKSGSWFYEIVAPGFKFNMTDISAAIGVEQLKKLEKFITKRTKIVAQYRKLFKNTDFTYQEYDKDIRHSHNLFPIILPDRLVKYRNQIIEDLKELSIGANVYYIPLNYHPFYQNEYGWKKGDAPVTEWIFDRLINLPLYPSLTAQDVSYVAKSLLTVIAKYDK